MTATRRHRFSARTRTVFRIGVMALGLALVMLVTAWFLMPRVTSVTAQGASGAQTQLDYQRGIAALTSQDTTAATELLKKAAAEGSLAASSKLAELAKTAPNSSTASTSGNTSASAAATAGLYASHIGDLSSVVPTAFSGFNTRTVTNDQDEFSVPLEPTLSGPYHDTIRLALVTIADHGSSGAADKFVAGITKAFSKNAASVTVGKMAGKFATDGTTTAVLRFARGRYAVEVVLTSNGVAPSTLKATALSIGALLPATK